MKAKKKTGKGEDYTELLKSIKGQCVTFKELASRSFQKNSNGHYFCVRHDIDLTMEGAVALAQLEHELGIRSTYFVLHTAAYFYANSFVRAMWKIKNLGHDIGIHNDSISQAVIMNQNAGDILKTALAFIRDVGIEVLGSSCHGSGQSYQYEFRNYQVFEEFDFCKNEGGAMAVPGSWKIALSELGLLYETYLNSPDYYLSDSHGKWYGIFVSKNYPMPFERTMSKMNTDQQAAKELAKKRQSIEPFVKTNYGLSIVTKFNRGWHPDTLWEKRHSILQLLVHPLYWKVTKK